MTQCEAMTRPSVGVLGVGHRCLRRGVNVVDGKHYCRLHTPKTPTPFRGSGPAIA